MSTLCMYGCSMSVLISPDSYPLAVVCPAFPHQGSRGPAYLAAVSTLGLMHRDLFMVLLTGTGLRFW